MNHIKAIVDTISDQIRGDMTLLDNEERCPRNSADEMDDKIKHLTERIRKLRVLRQDAESIFTGTNVA